MLRRAEGYSRQVACSSQYSEMAVHFFDAEGEGRTKAESGGEEISA
jgi:hypothetical protein